MAKLQRRASGNLLIGPGGKLLTECCCGYFEHLSDKGRYRMEPTNVTEIWPADDPSPFPTGFNHAFIRRISGFAEGAMQLYLLTASPNDLRTYKVDVDTGVSADSIHCSFEFGGNNFSAMAPSTTSHFAYTRTPTGISIVDSSCGGAGSAAGIGGPFALSSNNEIFYANSNTARKYTISGGSLVSTLLHTWAAGATVSAVYSDDANGYFTGVESGTSFFDRITSAGVQTRLASGANVVGASDKSVTQNNGFFYEVAGNGGSGTVRKLDPTTGITTTVLTWTDASPPALWTATNYHNKLVAFQ